VIDWFYKSWGNPQNPSLVFLHGFLGTSADWGTIIPPFEKDYFCIAVDLPGHGQTNVKDDFSFSFESTSASLIQLLSNICEKPFILAGYSMGGRLALYTALKYPQSISKIVLESCTPGIESKEERAKRVSSDQKWADKILNLPPNQLLDEWYDQPIFEFLRKNEKFAEMLKRRAQYNPELIVKSLMGLSQGIQPPLWDKQHQLAMPVLLISGEYDKKYVSLMEQMRKQIPNCFDTTIESAGHNVHLEQSERFVDILKKFVVL
jgi:2-succinyl-6-hydroxy-2,4-cyclohexadiene-1-carboxylate synthase